MTLKDVAFFPPVVLSVCILVVHNGMCFFHAWHLSLFFPNFIVMVVKVLQRDVSCHWSITDVALSVLRRAPTSQNLIIWKICAGRGVSQAMFWIDVNKSYVFDRFFCCRFSPVMVSTPQGGGQRPDRQKVQACVPLLTAKSLIFVKSSQRASEYWKWKHKSILSACQNAKGRDRERERERQRERPGHLKASVVSSGDGQPKHLRAVWMAF